MKKARANKVLLVLQKLSIKITNYAGKCNTMPPEPTRSDLGADDTGVLL
ncbi:hypothetical protein J8281_03895 [Aquimarina sp. U1-2]|nr:hypothetical protein [Aquimarina sp. U1-2]MBP2831321.1 hypothetical protein [Aquimarina sp. U1-2]